MKKQLVLLAFIVAFTFTIIDNRTAAAETPVLNGSWTVTKNQVVSKEGEEIPRTIFSAQFEKEYPLEIKNNQTTLLFQNGDSLKMQNARFEFEGSIVRVYVEGGKPSTGGKAEAYTEFDYFMEGNTLVFKKETPNYSTLIVLTQQTNYSESKE